MIEDILPLSPLQQGMLFHALYDTGSDDVYTVQFVLGLQGELDSKRLHAAAQRLLARHANLRAAFVHEDVDEPVQVVLDEVELPWTEVDGDLEGVLARDRAARFTLDEPPLLRMTLVRMSDTDHRLVLTNHHLLLDGWSLPLLVSELLALYGGTEPPRPRPYRDYLSWLSTRDVQASTEAWLRVLDDVEPTLLAPDASRVPTRPGKIRVDLPAERLYARAREEGLTVNTVVQSLWGQVLARLTGRDDVVFGATVSGRPPELSGVDSMIGLFINTVPVRVRADASPAELQAQQSSLMEHQYLGLTEIQRAAGGGDLFDTLVVFENYPIDSGAVGESERQAGIRISQVEVDDATHYPLTLAVAAEEALSVTFEYRSEVFDRERIEAITRYFTRAAESFAEGRPVELLFPEEYRQLAEFGTGKRLDVPAKTMSELFEEQARRTPDALAVVDGQRRLTFAELNRRANHVARLLVGQGAGPERIVALKLSASADMIIALLAVFKAGAAYLPLDPEWPAERIDLMLADAQPVAVLTEVPEGEADDLPQKALPEHPAYVIYTSGSTGTPKAVVVPHASIVNLLCSHRDQLFDPARERVGRPLRVAHAWPMAFDASWQPMLWLFAGHELHLVPPDVRRDADRLREFLAEHAIEFVELSPSLFAQVATEPWRGSLKVLGLGGEAVPGELWRMLRAEDDLAVYNLYGPTECTVDSAAADFADSESPSIGSPVGNARAYILDRRLRPCPVGVEGELYLAGAGLARGYLGRPGTTAERFVANPFEPGRMYRTGDVARWTADGRIEALGRVDDQVKIRGYRIEPGEIEAVLAREERVERVVVVPREDTPGVRRLVAYVVLREGGVEGLRERVAASLPDYMVPAAVVAVDSFPLTRNDKLDVKALPAPDYEGTTRAPRTETEAKLAELFAEVLGVRHVGADDSFFALGGDSIVSMRLVSKARAAGFGFSPRDVFERRTVAELALVAGKAKATADPDAGIGEVPLTPMLHWLTRNAPYDRLSQARLLCTPAGLDLDRLTRMLRTLLDRHDVLRSTFDSGFVVHPRGAEPALRRVELTDVAAQLPEVLEEELRELSPAQGRMARFVWFDRPGGDGRLLILLHHLVVDGASWGVLVPELADLWAGRELPPVGTSFREWAKALPEVARAKAPELDLWRDILSGPDPVLGTRCLDPARDTRATMRATRTFLDADLTNALLTTVPERLGVTVNDVLLTAFARAIARWRGEDGSVLIALEGHGREEQVVPGADLSGTVGWFTDVHPVRIDPTDVRKVAQQLALPDGGLGYGLLRYLNPDTAPELARLPEPQVEFNYLGRLTVGETEGQPWSGALEVGAMGGGVDDAMPAPYCLVLNALVRGSVLEADWQWASGIFPEDRIHDLSREWFAALKEIADE
ncbi:non-ribosomal peptide synthase domain TIGR01720/amino acid adenylation domain-containing protein [Amycolatopsis sacchari]|uniref:Non-ribosomal peptide synthase domain TIGR01720/amino acid adenylation domain-containing protein n=1 Tax=Amycolatopsis sacchari TaxID=115433 RepID=A0A1I3P3U4_9PSEU|nr:non-ribosomal peptide synthetase [Amycolatopsis sacchari]SFJ16099.1 non-ribosomal peptide synthase domain TIGR01720/amino acid adenylation domain-containing protein [Amycolatopsis sacchari]